MSHRALAFQITIRCRWRGMLSRSPSSHTHFLLQGWLLCCIIINLAVKKAKKEFVLWKRDCKPWKNQAQQGLKQHLNNCSIVTWGRTSPSEWCSTGTGCPGRVWSLLWWYSKPVWMPTCVTCCREPDLSEGWTWWSPEVPSNPLQLWSPGRTSMSGCLGKMRF